MRSQLCAHVLRDRKAWKTGLEERDIARTDLPRDIARDTKRGVGVAVQVYKIYRGCQSLFWDEPSKCAITYQRLSRTG